MVLLVRWNHRSPTSCFYVLVVLVSEVEFSTCSVFQFLHDFHHILGHEIWSSNAIVQLAVLAEANEDCVKSHLVDRHETMDDQEGEDDSNQDRDEGKLNRRVLLQR